MRFRLVRYFAFASLGVFALVTIALAYFQTQQAAFFQDVQRQEIEFFKQVQSKFAKQQDEAARRDLLTVHENGNVNLTRLFANALWEKDFAPFVAKVQAVPVEHCRAMPDIKGPDGKTVQPDEKKACYAEVSNRIRSMPEFAPLDAKVFEAMKKSTVFKIKVFDLRGITVYSSEHKQVGEDKGGNAGWQSAALGKPASELTHRDKFSAFEGVVENRDLISSYIPVYAPRSTRIVGVFEVYSDVTAFLDQIKKTSAQINRNAQDNQAQLEKVSASNQQKVEQSSLMGMGIVAGLLALLFASLFMIVRRAEAIIVRQERDREHAQQQLAQSEKMASLGQMVAGVAHQLNTPLAFSRSNVSMVKEALKSLELPLKVAHTFAKLVRSADGDKVTLNLAKSKAQVAQLNEADTDLAMLSHMLGDTLDGIEQMNELVEHLRDFTRLDRARITNFDVNKGMHNVVYIAKSVIPNRIEVVEEYGPLPMVECNPSQLNQVFLNLINNAAQSISDSGTITVRSSVDGKRIRIDVTDTGSGIAADVLPHIFDTYYTTKAAGEGTGLGLPIAKSIVDEHGGEIQVSTEVGAGTTFSVYLPIAQGGELRKAA
jgi:signal transduction histidine kinase